MGRKARLILPGYPHHIVQRGHNKQTVFRDDGDRRYYLDLLATYVQRYDCRLMAYCLMTNHIHLLIRPYDRNHMIKLLHGVGFMYAKYFNLTEERSGAFWENRYHSSVIMEEIYLWRVAQYICLNPVRAGIVENPGDYPWSSAKMHFNGEMNGLPIDDWIGDDRRVAFRESVLAESESCAIQFALQRNLPYVSSTELIVNHH
jgi:putative transposase